MFVDTGAFFALIDRDDPYYVLAHKTWAELLRSKAKLIISNYILAEAYTLLRYKLPQEISQAFLEILDESKKTGRLKVKFATPQMEKEVQELLLTYKEHDLSYTDAVSFIMIKQLEIQQIFTFDSHFKVLGANIIPIR